MSDVMGREPAFPTDSEGQVSESRYHYAGMTLRDYFAAKAMVALGSAAEWNTDNNRTQIRDGAARLAYEYADAMLAARAEAQP